MIIKNLTIHNIASIEDAFINFEEQPLADASVFLITGITGSGKSTILDAICLALYNETPRLKSWNDNGKNDSPLLADNISPTDTRQLLRRGCGEGSVTLVFDGVNGHEYTAVWSVRRARAKSDGALQNIDRELRRGNGPALTKQRDIKEEIVKATALTFEQFCRTSMLAQGEFSRFLKSPDNEKSEILSKITGGKIFSRIGEGIFTKYKTSRDLYDRCREDSEKLSPMSPEERQAKDDELNNLQAEAGKLGEQLKKATSVLNINAEISRNSADIETIQQKLTQLRSTFRGLIADRSTLGRMLKANAAEMDEVDKALGELQPHAEVLARQESLNLYLENYSKDTQAADKGAETKKRLDANLKLLLQDSDKSKQMLEEAEKALKAASETRRKAESLYDAEAYNNIVKEQTRLIERKGEIKNTRADISKLTDDTEKLAADEKLFKQLREEIDNLEKRKDAEKLAAETLRNASGTAEETYRRLFGNDHALLDKFDSVRASLQEGDTCPVCRRVIEEALPSNEEVRKLINEAGANAEKARKAVEEAAAKLNATKATLTEKRKSEKSQSSKLEKTKDSLAQKAADLSARLVKLYPDADKDVLADYTRADSLLADSLKAVDKQIKGLDKKIEEADALNKEAEKARKKERKAQTNKETASKTHSDNQKKVTDKQSQISVKEQEIAGLKQKSAEALDKALEILGDSVWANDATSRPEGLRKEVAGELKKLTNLEQRADNLRKKAEALNLLMENLERDFSSVTACQPDWSNDITDAAPEPGEDDVPAELNLKATEESSDSLRVAVSNKSTMLADKRNSRTAAQKRLSAALVEAGWKELPEDLEEIVNDCTSRQNTANQNIGSLKKAIEDDDKLITQHKQTLEKLDSLKKKMLKWEELNSLFGSADGRKFLKISQSYVLTTLVESANEYMAMLTSRYRLQVTPGSFSILVEDAYQGYAMRQASTISGGETFLVSLALALALSDFAGNLQVGMLFIDEGFGSLSGDDLTRAIETLRSLHTYSGRRVGIITHVESVGERIPVQIRVDRPGESSVATVTVTDSL